MLLRRFTQHVNEQNWFAVGIDFVIVVIGVFIGIQVSAWNQARIDRQDEAIFLENLHQDIESVQTLSKRLLNVRHDNFNKLGELVDALNGQAPERKFTVEDCSTIGTSDVFYVGRTDLPALIQLRNAGRTNIISDPDLQAALAGLVQKREALEIVIASTTGKIWDFRKLFTEHFHMLSSMIPDPSNPGTFERTLTFDTCDIDLLLDRVDVRNGLAINIEFYDAVMRDGLRPWVVQVEEVHNRVDELLLISH